MLITIGTERVKMGEGEHVYEGSRVLTSLSFFLFPISTPPLMGLTFAIFFLCKTLHPTAIFLLSRRLPIPSQMPFYPVLFKFLPLYSWVSSPCCLL